jgi:hypothetical protein
VEEEYDGQKDAQHISFFMAFKSEYKVKCQNKHKDRGKPNDVEYAKFFRNRIVVSKNRLRRINGHHYENDTRQGDEEGEPFPFIQETEAMLFTDLEKKGNGNGNTSNNNGSQTKAPGETGQVGRKEKADDQKSEKTIANKESMS